jgi:predicted nucleic acid-binding protein
MNTVSKPKLYLDNCCFNRPFDDQSQLLVRLETEAKLYIQEGIKNGMFELVWSYVLDFESNANPSSRRRKFVQTWKSFAVTGVEESEALLILMESFERWGVKPVDALHLAAAVIASADFFITVDHGILNKTVTEIRVISPEKFIRYYEETTNNA